MKTVGPEVVEINIDKPEKVAFKMPELIGDLIHIYTNLGSFESFCKSVVKDDRSFKIQFLQKARMILKKKMGVYDLSELENFITKLSHFKQEE
jgi:hypothetical protein